MDHQQSLQTYGRYGRAGTAGLLLCFTKMFEFILQYLQYLSLPSSHSLLLNVETHTCQTLHL